MLPRAVRCLVLLPCLLILAAPGEGAGEPPRTAPEPLPPPAWVRTVTRMAYGGWNEIEPAARAGAQVFHTNLVWPYYPLARNGGGLGPDEAEGLRRLVRLCRKHGMRLSLGLPPFPSVEHVRAHPDWRILPTRGGDAHRVPPTDNLGTRLGCNLGPWGDYLIEVCAELVQDFGVDGFSFDGNYHPPVCYCTPCRAAYRAERGRDLPPAAALDDLRYREYLVWRGEKLEQHYARLQRRIRQVNPEAAVMTWTTNAGRYGHLLTSPRVMTTRMNRFIDLPMQEWWLDETNLGASVAPAFGAAYLKAVAGDRPAASEPYLMSRGNPYGTDSFPAHERLVRTLLAITYGNATAQSFGWPGHRESARRCLEAVRRREPWLVDARPHRWGAVLVSEQTRQFYAYGNITERFMPHVYGAFRLGVEEHLPLTLINDWDLTAEGLRDFRVIVLPNAAAISDAQAAALREFVRQGGGLVATGETSLCDELGRPRPDFALADLYGVSYRGRPVTRVDRPELDANFAIALDERYWRERTGLARLSWGDHPLLDEPALRELVPTKDVQFRGPLVRVSEPVDPASVAVRLRPDGDPGAPLPAVVVRKVGRGRVVYLAAGLEAALWSYAYPYQRRLLGRCLREAAGEGPVLRVEAPPCVHATVWEQGSGGARRTLVHLFNDLNPAAGHGHPAAEVPLRESAVPVSGIRVRFPSSFAGRAVLQPGGRSLPLRPAGRDREVNLPPLAVHSILVLDHAPRPAAPGSGSPVAGRSGGSPPARGNGRSTTPVGRPAGVR